METDVTQNIIPPPPTDEDAEAKRFAVPERRPLKGRDPCWTPTDFEDMAYLKEHLGRAGHQFAHTMAGHPHYYTLAKKHWPSKDAFDEVVAVMKRQLREQEQYRGTWYSRLRLNGYKHWLMSNNPILINRAPIEYYDTWLPHAYAYETAFSSEEDVAESAELLRNVPGLKLGQSVLDVGCGTGALLDWNWQVMGEGCYTGIDVSLGMLGVFREKHPSYGDCLIRTSFEDFWTPRKFDKIVAMRGVGSHINNPALLVSKCAWLLKPGGEAIISYYRMDKPVRMDQRLGITEPKAMTPPEQDNPLVTHETGDWYTHVRIRPKA